MLTKFGSNIAKTIVMGLLVWAFCGLSLTEASAQDIMKPNSGGGPTTAVDLTTKRVDPSPPRKPETVEEQLSALHQLLEQQGRQLISSSKRSSSNRRPFACSPLS